VTHTLKEELAEVLRHSIDEGKRTNTGTEPKNQGA
jgi:hypothetical protein